MDRRHKGQKTHNEIHFRNGKCIPVHRNILVARSPVFAELLRRAEEEEELPDKKVGGLKFHDIFPNVHGCIM